MTSSMQGSATTGANGAPRQGEQLQHAASGLLDQATRTADAQASTRMTMLGETIDGVAKSIQDAAGRLRETQPDLAGYVETGASRLDEAATYLRDHTASEALDSVQQIARRQPALIVGGGLIAGLLIGRFLRTGASAAQGGSDMTPGGGGSYGAGGYARGGYGAGTSGAYGAAGYESSGYDATGYGVGTADELAATDAAVDATVIDVEVEEIGVLGGPTTGQSRTGSEGR